MKLPKSYLTWDNELPVEKEDRPTVAAIELRTQIRRLVEVLVLFAELVLVWFLIRIIGLGQLFAIPTILAIYVLDRSRIRDLARWTSSKLIMVPSKEGAP